jgi:Flp pilus assembly protein TadB
VLRRRDEQRRRETIVVFVCAMAFGWSEIQRRLGVLNHAHEKAIEVQHTYVTQEKFDDALSRNDEFRNRVSQALAERKGDKATGIRWTAIAVTIAVAVIGLIIVLANVLTSAHP